MSPIRAFCFAAIGLAVAHPSLASADVVLDWNATLRSVIQQNGVGAAPKADPGWSTRAIAMMNTAIYDAFQARQRTHRPWLVDVHAGPSTSLEAAVHQAAYEILAHCYGSETPLLQSVYNARMGAIADGPEKTSGMALGSMIASACVAERTGDGSASTAPYTPQNAPGMWRPDPYHPAQNAWGPAWGAVSPFAIPATTGFLAALPSPPPLGSEQYAEAYNQVKDFGALNSPSRSPEQTEIGLFWAYDRPNMGPPPVLFVRNLEEIAAQAGNTPTENARMFAMASVAMADAAIAAWDAKFQHHFWRPVTAIHEGDADGNAATAGDADWRPLGAPGDDPDAIDDDFTPPFPAWTSGHATMGSALFKSLELFYGTNSFDEIDGLFGNQAFYELTSEEAGGGDVRQFSSFTQSAELAPGLEDSPEGENGMSRVYLGVHWIFDQRDGMALGRSIAQHVSANFFQPVPEPAGPAVILAAVMGLSQRRRVAEKVRRTAR
ncbi:MAG: chloroperoxidase [Planctomycetota bacterium]|nr:MAG: chloroperoxidase [Planctomycetota bacterium]